MPPFSTTAPVAVPPLSTPCRPPLIVALMSVPVKLPAPATVSIPLLSMVALLAVPPTIPRSPPLLTTVPIAVPPGLTFCMPPLKTTASVAVPPPRTPPPTACTPPSIVVLKSLPPFISSVPSRFSRVRGLGGIWVSGGEAEGVHFVGVLSFGDEFREDGALGSIQEKFGQSLA